MSGDEGEAQASAPGAPRGLGRRGLALGLLLLGTPLLALVSPWTEALGATTGVVCVWLAARSDFWTWPVGIANNLLYLVVFWESRLYADSLLQVVYVAISIYGIWRWRSGRGEAAVRPVERARRGERVLVALAVILLTVVFALVLTHWSDSDVPWADGLTTAMSLGAQWLMSRRMLENWKVWIAADLIYVPLYLYKGLQVTAGLYAVFLAICISGLIEWRRELVAREAGRSDAIGERAR